MNAFLAAGTGLSNIACSAEECLSWIIILLNILTVFYLVFCAWFKVTKTVKIIGYVWASALTVGTIAVVAVHTCIFTILSAVFTGMILMAVLSVVFNKGVFAKEEKEDEKEKEKTEKPQRPLGAYVIHRTDDNKYVFVLYNNRKTFIAKSIYKYASIEETKKAIAVCRENGFFASVENKTKSWIEFVNHPKFIMFEENGKFLFKMTLADETVIVMSEPFEVNEQCEKSMKEAVSIVKSEKMYYSEKEVLAGSLFSVLPLDKEEIVLRNIVHEVAPMDKKTAAKKESVAEPVITEEVVATEEIIETSDGEEEESIIVTDEQGQTFRILLNKSFTAKLMQSSEETKRYYTELKNEILSYKPTKSRLSWFYDSVNTGRNPLVKFSIRGKYLCVYYALNYEDYADSKYKVEKTDALKYATVPCMYRIKNNRRLKFAKQLIAAVCEKAGLQKGIVANEDYGKPYDTTESLIKKGLIKQIKTKK